MDTHSSEHDKRRFSRVPFVSQITLTQKGRQWHGTVVDICFDGILISGESFPLTDNSTSVDSTIRFGNGISIYTKLTLAHQHDGHYGLHFAEIDTDSLTHLRQLIMHNLGNEDACERELMALFNNNP